MAGATILVIDDERDIQEVVRFNLEAAGYRVLLALDAGEGLAKARRERPELVVLDLLLPGMSGREVCRQLKQVESTRHIPVLMLTALSSEDDRIRGFEAGADDYLVKPFSPRELVLRIKAILRTVGEPRPVTSTLKLGRLVVDPLRHQALLDDQPLELTVTEFKLLHHLAARNGLVQTRQVLLEKVWGYSYEGYSRTVDTHVRRLRNKLGPVGPSIQTVRGIGYRFQAEQP
ncbi:MAG: response regulator transcription factor [Thermodesulfobacteriota bacterium]